MAEEGKVKWFDKAKGFGFIERDNEKDLFVHHSEVDGGELSEGQNCTFELGDGPKGPCAVNVRPA